MKKLICYALTFCMLFSLCGCKKQTEKSITKSSKPQKTETIEIPYIDEGPMQVTVTNRYSFINPFVMPHFNYGSYYDQDADMDIPYRYSLPANQDDGKKPPIVLFFHGNGSIGTDNTSHMWGITDSYSVAGDIMNEAIVVMPQTPTGWDVFYGYGVLDIAVKIADYLAYKYNGDKNRIYVTGLSLGGFATWDAVDAYPNHFAAALPVCGGVYNKNIESYLQTPIWTYHGNADGIVAFESTYQTYNNIKASGGEKIKFIELDGIDHNAWDYAYTDRECLSWLFSQQKGGEQSLNYTYRNYFEIVSSDGTVLVSEKDTDLIHTGFDGFKLHITDKAVERLENSYTKNPNQTYTVKVGSQKLYDFTIQSFSKENTFKIEKTLDENNYNLLYIVFQFNMFNQKNRDQIYKVHS